MQDTGNGEIMPVESATQTAFDRAIPDRRRQGILLTVGEEVAVKSGRFRVHSIGRKRIVLEGLPGTHASSHNYDITPADAGKKYESVTCDECGKQLTVPSVGSALGKIKYACDNHGWTFGGCNTNMLCKECSNKESAETDKEKKCGQCGKTCKERFDTLCDDGILCEACYQKWVNNNQRAYQKECAEVYGE